MPRVEGEADLFSILRHDWLGNLGTSLHVPDLEEEGVDHDAGRKGAVLRAVGSEQLRIGFAEDGGGFVDVGLAPVLVIGDWRVPQRFRAGQGNRIKLVAADGRCVVEGEGEQTEDDVDGKVRPLAAFVDDPFVPTRQFCTAFVESLLQLVPTTNDQLYKSVKLDRAKGAGGPTLERRPLIEQPHSRPFASPLQLANTMFNSKV